LCTYPPHVALVRHQLPLGFDVKGRCDIPPKRSDSDIATLGTMPNRRFTPPWSIEDIGTAYVVKDGGGQKLAYLHYEDEPGRRSTTKMLTKDETRRLRRFAKLPELLCKN